MHNCIDVVGIVSRVLHADFLTTIEMSSLLTVAKKVAASAVLVDKR